MGSREERLGRNEALFRQVNERIAEESGSDLVRLEIVCECTNLSCIERIELQPSAYEKARRNEVTFIVLIGHINESVERVVAREKDYVLVEKLGDAADVAEETDPRSDEAER
jgi:hypothetical protein